MVFVENAGTFVGNPFSHPPATPLVFHSPSPPAFFLVSLVMRSGWCKTSSHVKAPLKRWRATGRCNSCTCKCRATTVQLCLKALNPTPGQCLGTRHAERQGWIYAITPWHAACAGALVHLSAGQGREGACADKKNKGYQRRSLGLLESDSESVFVPDLEPRKGSWRRKFV